MPLLGKTMNKNTKKYKNKDGISGVYSITNMKSDIVYVGESFNIEERWMSHIDELKKGKHHNKRLQTDWNIYGKENFKFEILEKLELEFICDGLPYEYKKCVLLIKEAEYIDKYDSYNNGYNAEYTVDEILVGNKDKELLNCLVNCIHIYKNNDNRIPDSICAYLQNNTD
ncbi:MAG TPA: GIY-YIG nuclease family protein, partial [Romboutsia timonensis]|nr:GIY-YIG nuclease family protein [Romboutsia timonensis]